MQPSGKWDSWKKGPSPAGSSTCTKHTFLTMQNVVSNGGFPQDHPQTCTPVHWEWLLFAVPALAKLHVTPTASGHVALVDKSSSFDADTLYKQE